MARQKLAWAWERLDDCTERAKVIGGWLMRTIIRDGKLFQVSTTFVPDRDYDWLPQEPFSQVEAKPLAKSKLAADFEPPKAD